MQIGNSFNEFETFLPGLPHIIDNKVEEAIKNELKELQERTIREMIKEQADPMIDESLSQIDTETFREEAEAQIQGVSAIFEKAMSGLQERMEEVGEHRTMTQEEKEELQNLVKKMKEMKQERQEYKEDLENFIADFKNFKKKVVDMSLVKKVSEGAWQDGTVAMIMSASALVMSKIAFLLLYKKIKSRTNASS